MLLPLLLKTWRDHLKGIIGWAVGTAALVIVMLWVYPTVAGSNAGMDQISAAFPQEFQEMFRMNDYTSPAGYLSAELFSFMIPLIFVAMGVSWGAAVMADEEEHGTADLLYSLPIPRWRILIVKWLAVMIAVIVIGVIFWVTLVIGAPLAGMEIGLAQLTAASLGTVLIGCLYATLGYFLAAVTGKKAMSLGISIVLALTAFLIYMLAPLVDAIARFESLSPFQWAYGNEPLWNGFDAGFLVLLAAATAVLLTASLVIFGRRDIGA
jgi:ABC-2 type transport system permease protein